MTTKITYEKLNDLREALWFIEQAMKRGNYPLLDEAADMVTRQLRLWETNPSKETKGTKTIPLEYFLGEAPTKKKTSKTTFSRKNSISLEDFLEELEKAPKNKTKVSKTNKSPTKSKPKRKSTGK